MTLLRKAWPVLELIGLGFSIGYAVNLVIIFYLAYFNPGRSVLVGVDRFGEAGIEAVLFPVSIVTAIIAWFRLTWR